MPQIHWAPPFLAELLFGSNTETKIQVLVLKSTEETVFVVVHPENLHIIVITYKLHFLCPKEDNSPYFCLFFCHQSICNTEPPPIPLTNCKPRRINVLE